MVARTGAVGRHFGLVWVAAAVAPFFQIGHCGHRRTWSASQHPAADDNCGDDSIRSQQSPGKER